MNKGVEVAMLTGDNAGTAKRIARRLGIDIVLADVRPGQEAEKIKELQARGLKVGMVGDEVNDAPAVTQADIGFAIGAGTAALAVSGSSALVAINTLMLKRTRLKGIRHPETDVVASFKLRTEAA
jgi:Cu2+-exporting ATPase